MPLTQIPSSLLNIWRTRCANGPYKNTGDAFTFSADEYQRSWTRAQAFIKSPIVWGNDNNVNQTLWLGYSGTVVDPNNTTAQYPLRPFISALDTATHYAINPVSNASFALAVKQALLAQVRYQGQAGYVGARVGDWAPVLTGNANVRPYAESGTIESAWIERMAMCYMYTRPVYTASERVEIETYLKGWASYFMAQLDRQLATYTPNRLATTGDPYAGRKSYMSDTGELYLVSQGRDPIYPAPQYDRHTMFYPGETRIPLWLEPDGSVGAYQPYSATFYSNRAATKVGMALCVSAVTDDATIKRSAIAWVRDWLAYAVFPNGMMGENERNGDYANYTNGVRNAGCLGFENRGASHYSADILEPLMRGAFYLACAGDYSLRDLTVTFGVHGTQCTGDDAPKSLWSVATMYGKLATNQIDKYYAYVSPATRLSLVTKSTCTRFSDKYQTYYASICGIASLLYDDAWLASVANKTAPGMDPYPSGGYTTVGSISMFRNGNNACLSMMSLQYAGITGLNLFSQLGTTVTGEGVTLTTAKSHVLVANTTEPCFWTQTDGPKVYTSSPNKNSLVINPLNFFANLDPGAYKFSLKIGNQAKVVTFTVA